MRLTRILPIILLLTACAPAAPVPTATPLPPTVTATAAASSTSTMEPTATETATKTAEPTSTNTVEPIPTSTPDSLPEGVKDLQTAIETGWRFSNGKWGQHIVWTEGGEIKFDTITMDFSKYEQKPGGAFYKSPLGTPWKLGAKKDGYITDIFEFLTSEVNMKDYVNTRAASQGFYVEISTDKNSYRFLQPDSPYFATQSFWTDSTDKGKLEGGYITLCFGLPEKEVVKQIKFARKPGASLWVIYDKDEMSESVDMKK